MTDPISLSGGERLAVSRSSEEPARAGFSAERTSPPATDTDGQAPSSNINASEPVTQESLLKASEALANRLKKVSTDLQFQVDKDTNILVFKVIDATTRQVIREYPPEAVLKMAKAIQEQLQDKNPVGVLMDTQH